MVYMHVLSQGQTLMLYTACIKSFVNLSKLASKVFLIKNFAITLNFRESTLPCLLFSEHATL